MRILRKKYFNLVEIVLAVGVIAVGVTGVLALMPPALNANRDAVADTLAGEAAANMTEYLQFLAKEKVWDAAGTDYNVLKISTTKPGFQQKKLNDITNLTTNFMNNPNVKRVSDNTFFVLSGDQTLAVEVILQRKNITDFYLPSNPGTGQPINQEYVSEIVMEISWPTTAVGARKQKRYFLTSLTNPNKVN